MPALQLHPLETSGEIRYSATQETDTRKFDIASRKMRTTATVSRAERRTVTRFVLEIIAVSAGVGMLLQFTAQRLLDWLAQNSPVGMTHRWENVLVQTASFIAVVVLGTVIGLRADRRAIVPGILLGNLVARSASLACILFPILAAHMKLPPFFIWLPVLSMTFLETVTEIGIALYVAHRKKSKGAISSNL